MRSCGMLRTALDIMADAMKLLTPWQQSQVIDYALRLAIANKPRVAVRGWYLVMAEMGRG
jgi:hypothetical protein